MKKKKYFLGNYEPYIFNSEEKGKCGQCCYFTSVDSNGTRLEACSKWIEKRREEKWRGCGVEWNLQIAVGSPEMKVREEAVKWNLPSRK